MKRKDLESLNDIASMIRDREMATLARLNQHRLRLETERTSITQDMHAARREGADNLMLAQAAETYAKWGQMRQAQIEDNLAQLQPLIEAQRQRTAAATGRHRNLGEIGKKMLAEQLIAKEKRL
ncbi:hypothetical protein FBT96_02290 [Rhodobacter capsulatus]|uniref:Flagellar export protein FliJ n=1 Tax=Rhodobacter capsulatus TaxID=1061 RepID=A0A4U1K2E4_RHOCA|nr:hypothetical protein [Rhodobacter capsulatus]TKD26191.1 hypothetical protein FBT96_02290 [Rhodobacter capsulatus]